MPSHSEAQARLMAAIAHGWHPTGLKHAPSQAVAHDFNQADKGSALLHHAMQHKAAGGVISPLAQAVGNPMTMRASLPHLGQPYGMSGRMRMPRIPLADTMHNIDQHMAGARVKLPKLKAQLAAGGQPPVLGPHGMTAVKNALTHLTNRDASSASATLRASREAMQNPAVRQAAQDLRTAHGIAGAHQALIYLQDSLKAGPQAPR